MSRLRAKRTVSLEASPKLCMAHTITPAKEISHTHTRTPMAKAIKAGRLLEGRLAGAFVAEGVYQARFSGPNAPSLDRSKPTNQTPRGCDDSCSPERKRYASAGHSDSHFTSPGGTPSPKGSGTIRTLPNSLQGPVFVFQKNGFTPPIFKNGWFLYWRNGKHTPG